MLKRLIVVSVLMLVSGLEAGKQPQACRGTTAIEGISGTATLKSVKAPTFDPYTGVTPGSISWNRTAGCGFTVNDSIICAYDVTAGWPLNANFDVAWEFDLLTPVVFDQPFCKKNRRNIKTLGSN